MRITAAAHILIARYSDKYPEEDMHLSHQMPPPMRYAAPITVLARRGMASILPGLMGHSGSVPPGEHERRVILIEY